MTDSSIQPENFLRVKASKVSLLLDLTGELSLSALAVTRHPALQGHELIGFETAAHQLELLITEVQRLVADLRLVSVSGLFRPMQRIVHDLARETGECQRCFGLCYARRRRDWYAPQYGFQWQPSSASSQLDLCEDGA